MKNTGTEFQVALTQQQIVTKVPHSALGAQLVLQQAPDRVLYCDYSHLVNIIDVLWLIWMSWMNFMKIGEELVHCLCNLHIWLQLQL